MSDLVNITEVFSSIQGEGLYVGCKQIFVRLSGCNLQCAYCDTLGARLSNDFANIERIPGSRDFKKINNPVSLERLANIINIFLSEVPHHSVSFTGGEPLCQCEQLSQLLPVIKGQRYLETNGTLPDQLNKVLKHVDIISMDIKLPSCLERSYWEEHKRFLSIAQRKNVFVKIVVTGMTNDMEFNEAVALLAEVNKEIPLIIQPVTTSSTSSVASASCDKLIGFQSQAMARLKDVRIIPQTHKYLGFM